MSDNQHIGGVTMIFSIVPLKIHKRLIMLTLGIQRLNTKIVAHIEQHVLWCLPLALHLVVLVPSGHKLAHCGCAHVELVAVIAHYIFYIVRGFARLIDGEKYNAGI